jgi:hypothetical protein
VTQQWQPINPMAVLGWCGMQGRGDAEAKEGGGELTPAAEWLTRGEVVATGQARTPSGATRDLRPMSAWDGTGRASGKPGRESPATRSSKRVDPAVTKAGAGSSDDGADRGAESGGDRGTFAIP